jgi:flagellar motor switch protein FliG
VNFAIDCIIKDIYDDIFTSKLKIIAIKEHNTLTSHILSNIICSEHPQITFEKLLNDKCYQ